MNAIELLKQQHREVDALFDQLGVPGEPGQEDPADGEDEVAVGSFLHPDGHTETTEEADSRFRDEGGASAMDASAGEYDGTTRGRDKPTQGVGMASVPQTAQLDGTRGTEIGRASTLLNTGRASSQHQDQREDYEEDPSEVVLDPRDDRLAASWQDLPMAHGSKVEAMTSRAAGLHDSPNVGSPGEHVAHDQSEDDADQHAVDDTGLRTGPRGLDDAAGRIASPAARTGNGEPQQFQDDRQAIFDRLAEALIAHSTVEEQIFYPAARSSQTDDLLYEAVEEHASVRRLIDELKRMRHGDKAFQDKLSLLREKVDNHVHDEETELFPNVIEELGAERLEELGRLIEARFRTLSSNGPVRSRPVSSEESAQKSSPARMPQDQGRRAR